MSMVPDGDAVTFPGLVDMGFESVVPGGAAMGESRVVAFVVEDSRFDVAFVPAPLRENREHADGEGGFGSG